MGRRKIAIEKIEKRAARNVAFSKRRTGAFRKAEQLCKLCGAEVAIIVYSPADKPYVFGYPDAETVFDRFLDFDAAVNADTGVCSSVVGQVGFGTMDGDGRRDQDAFEVGGVWWDAESVFDRFLNSDAAVNIGTGTGSSAMFAVGQVGFGTMEGDERGDPDASELGGVWWNAEMVLDRFLNSDAAVNTNIGTGSSAMFAVGQVGFGTMEGDERGDPDASELGGVWWNTEMVLDRFLNSDAAVNTNIGTGSSALFPVGQKDFGRMEGEEKGYADGSEVGGVWCDAPLQKMGLEQLETYGDYLEELMRKAGVRAGMMESYSNAVTSAAPGQQSHYQPEIPVELDQEALDLDFHLDGQYFRFCLDDFEVGL